MKKVKIGIIGCGSSRFMFAPLFRYLKEKCEFTAAVDTDRDLAQWMQDEYGAKEVYTDYEKMLNKADINAVIVATPTFLHEEQVVASAQAGKHVLCEKPMARTRGECQRMIKACEEAEVILMVGFMKRFSPSMIKVREMIDEGELGEVYGIRVDWTQSGYGRPRGQRDLMENLGGVYLDHGSHATDLCRWWAGDIVAVKGKVRIGLVHKYREVDDLAIALLEHESGVVTLHQINITDHKPPTERYEISGTKGTLHVSFGGFGLKDFSFRSLEPFKMLLYRNGSTVLDVTPYDFPSEGVDALNPDKRIQKQFSYCKELEYFCDCVIKGNQPCVSGDDGMKAIEVANAVYLSAATGEQVRLPLKEEVDLKRIFEDLNGKAPVALDEVEV